MKYCNINNPVYNNNVSVLRTLVAKLTTMETVGPGLQQTEKTEKLYSSE